MLSSGLSANLLLASFLSYTKRAASIQSFKSPVGRDPRVGNVWVIEDVYEGSNFFDRWDFWDQGDPTHGTVNYVDRSTAFGTGLAYVQPDGIVIMRGDNTTHLPAGANRNSVRIQSQKLYTGGLFILDTNHAPWGCGIWPAWWTVGDNWPHQGEIDMIEGVHDNEHNQVTWHTGPDCFITNTGNFSGTILGTTCESNATLNNGCAVTDWSRASYGPVFDGLGGGIYAMLWDETGIAVWYFYRDTIPADLLNQSPDPTTWSIPSAYLSPDNCDLTKHFFNHSIVFDITFCGDWAGNSYATSGCPGSCQERIQDPANFVNASWSINSLRVYQKQQIFGATNRSDLPVRPSTVTLATLLVLFLFLWR